MENLTENGPVGLGAKAPVITIIALSLLGLGVGVGIGLRGRRIPETSTDISAPAASDFRGSPSASAAPSEPEAGGSATAAAAELTEQLNRVRETGPASGETQRLFESTMASFRARLAAETFGARVVAEQCFRSACTFTMRFPSTIGPARVDRVLTEDQAFVAWPGGKFRSGPLTIGTETAAVTWILFLDQTREAADLPPS